MRVFAPIDPSLATQSNQHLNFGDYNIRGLYESPDGRIFRYILAEDGDIAANNACSYATSYGSSSAADAGEVTDTSTSDIEGGLDTINICAGVAAGDITDGKHGFLHVSGLASVNAAGDNTDSILAGDCLVMTGGNTPDGSVVAGAAGEEHAVMGLAITRESGNVVLAHLRRIL